MWPGERRTANFRRGYSAAFVVAFPQQKNLSISGDEFSHCPDLPSEHVVWRRNALTCSLTFFQKGQLQRVRRGSNTIKLTFDISRSVSGAAPLTLHQLHTGGHPSTRHSLRSSD